jgi:hypothetical protein
MALWVYGREGNETYLHRHEYSWAVTGLLPPAGERHLTV